MLIGLSQRRWIFSIAYILVATALAGCATETHRTVAPEAPVSAAVSYQGTRATVVVARFDNRSTYLRGIFTDSVDRLGGQAKTILIGHLNTSGRFAVVERDSMQQIAQEAKIKGEAQTLKGADFAIVGDVAEFGRTETGDRQLFGVLGSGKEQVAYTKVTVNVVDVKTSEVVFSAQGAGEYKLSNREVLGFGGTAGYDATLNGKVLDLAIREAVDRLVEGYEQGRWGRR